MNILLVTPMQEEFDHFLRSCTQCGFSAVETVVGRLPVARFPELDITLARGGVGKAQFALQTQHLLDTCSDWELVICAGAAGALIAGLSVGDVVVASATVEHDYNNGFNERPAPRFDGAECAIASLGRVSLPSSTFRVHIGTVASGDEDVVEVERRRNLHQATCALVVAWEGAGGARACAFSEVPFVEIRAVTDRADHNAPSDFENNLEVAINNVAILVTSWVLQSCP